MGPLDGPGLMWPDAADALDTASEQFVLVGHSNYGGDFGFDPLETTSAVRRHVPLAKRFGVPWVSDHCFYGDASWADVWSSPLQFSRAEAARVAARARTLQNLYGVPLWPRERGVLPHLPRQRNAGRGFPGQTDRAVRHVSASRSAQPLRECRQPRFARLLD